MADLTYRSPRTEVRPSPIHGKGLFAKRPIARGEIVAVKGGYVLTKEEWASLEPTLGAADILVRDGNYAVVMLDLRDVPAAALQRTPATVWHRLHRAVEPQPAAGLVLSRHGLVPAVRRRLVLEATWTADSPCTPQAERAGRLQVRAVRGLQHEALTA